MEHPRYSIPQVPIEETEVNHLATALRQLRELHGSGEETPFLLACWQIGDLHAAVFGQEVDRCSFS